MSDVFFLIFLFGPFVYGTLAAGLTRSMGRMIGWGIFSLLPLLPFLVISCFSSAPFEQGTLVILNILGGALFLHVAVSYGIRSFTFREKKEMK